MFNFLFFFFFSSASTEVVGSSGFSAEGIFNSCVHGILLRGKETHTEAQPQTDR